MNFLSQHKDTLPIISLSFAAGILVIGGVFFPEHLWGWGLLTGMPVGPLYFLMGLLAVLFASVAVPRFNLRLPTLPSQTRNIWLLAGGVAIVLGLLSYIFPLAAPAFGDSRYIIDLTKGVATQWEPRFLTDIFKLDFANPKEGTETIIAIMRLLSYFTGQDGSSLLLWVNRVCGAAFALVWVQFVLSRVTDNASRWMLLIMGLTAPCTQMFYGHYEYYGPVYLSLLLYSRGLLRYIEQDTKGFPWTILLLLLVCLKFHITSFLLLIPTTMVIVYMQRAAWRGFFTWQKLGLWLMMIGLLAGMGIYFFIFKNHDGPRAFTKDTLEEALFLPLYTNEGPPLDRYNLLSLAHIGDYLNLLGIWSPVAIFLLGAVLLTQGKQLPWNAPTVFILGFTSLMYAAAFFVLNPLLSMVCDWDLFSLPAIPLMVFTALLLSKAEDKPSQQWIGPVLALGIMGMAWIFGNAQEETLSNRLRPMGRHVFKTYWIGASTMMHLSSDLLHSTDQAQSERLETLEVLRPYAVIGNDIEFADILCEAGLYYTNEENDRAKALPYFQEAYKYQYNLSRNVLHLLTTHFLLGQYKEAHKYSKTLIGVRKPSYERAYRIAIHTAVEAEAYEDALDFCNNYLAIWPDNAFVKRVRQSLQTSQDPAQTKLLFKQG
ncbi:MAG: tetratricopeptide repeat protein [Bacteroidota bacterium]